MKKKIKLIFALILCLAIVSCNKWLDIRPENSTPDAELFSTGEGFRNALNGIYINLADYSLYGQELTWGFLSAISQQYNQTTEGNVSKHYPDAARFLYKTDETEPIIKNIWEKSYTAIANINKLLDFANQADPGIFDYGADELDLIRGEALALRAMIHFDLLRLFAPAPNAPNNGDRYIPYRKDYSPHVAEKLTLDEFLTQTCADIDSARKLLYHFDIEVHPFALNASNTSNQEEVPFWNAYYRYQSDRSVQQDNWGRFFWWRGSRLNYLALLGIGARINLYAGNDPKAKEFALELFDTYYKNLRWIGFSQESKVAVTKNKRYSKLLDDVLFSVYKSNLTEQYSDVSAVLSGENVTTIPFANIPSLFASDNTNIYTDWRLEYILATTNEATPSYYSLKYEASIDDDIAGYQDSYVPIIRFSEVCHILAEIACREGDLTKGIEYLEEVRSARGATRPLNLTVTSSDELMNEIILDARKEFLGEGQTFFLFKRLNIQQIESQDETGSVNMSGNYVLPIPDSESAI